MESTWEILKRELAYHKIKLIDNKTCHVIHDGKKYNVPIPKAVNFIHKLIRHNKEHFNSLWNDIPGILTQNCSCSCSSSPIDLRLLNLFSESLKDLRLFAQTCSSCSPEFKNFLYENRIFKAIKMASLVDIQKFSPETISTLPDYEIAIIWTFRKNCSLDYISNLLLFSMKGQEYVCSKLVKTARGISGPWSNLDLPMQERTFSWSDIEEEVTGREKDKERQRRYRQGFENYNNDGRVGEGYYWRELRNEPFSWYNRGTDSPYPSRSTLGNW